MKPLFLLSVVFALAGCKKGYDPALMSKLNAGEHKLVGKYKLVTEFNGEGAKELKDLMEMMAAVEGGETTLECLPDKTFTMMTSEVPVTGSWTLEKELLWFTIKKVGDQKPGDVVRVELGSMFKSGFDMSAAERDKYLKGLAASMALERAESLTKFRVGVDGTLHAEAGEPSMFGAMVSYFKKEAQ